MLPPFPHHARAGCCRMGGAVHGGVVVSASQSLRAARHPGLRLSCALSPVNPPPHIRYLKTLSMHRHCWNISRICHQCLINKGLTAPVGSGHLLSDSAQLSHYSLWPRRSQVQPPGDKVAQHFPNAALTLVQSNWIPNDQTFHYVQFVKLHTSLLTV